MVSSTTHVRAERAEPGRVTPQGKAPVSVRPARARVAPRLALLAAGAVCLLAGLDAALLRLGVWAPVAGTLSVRLGALHGPLMLVGFLGAVIALERAVASRRWWSYLAPALLAGGCLMLLVGSPLVVGQAVIVAGSCVLLAVYAGVYRRAPSVALDVEAMAGACLTLGCLVWSAQCAQAASRTAVVDPAAGVVQAVPLWLLFPVLTIVGERLELARVAFLDPVVERTVRALSAVAVLAACMSLLTATAHLVLGAALAGLGVVMAWYDVARRTIRSAGTAGAPVRYAAASMLAGYAWLLLAAVVWVLTPLTGQSAAYEVVIHALALGYAFSMILAHAPTIVPAIVHRRLTYHRLMWVPFALLHAGLAVRVLGLMIGQARAWQAGGVLGVLAVLTFLAVSLTRALTGGSIRTLPAPRPRPERP